MIKETIVKLFFSNSFSFVHQFITQYLIVYGRLFTTNRNSLYRQIETLLTSEEIKNKNYS